MYLTFDVGTTAVKTALYDMKGELVSLKIKDYRLESPQVDWYEMDPEIYWNSVIEGFKEILGRSDVSPMEIKTISGCSQGETVLFIDKNDRAIRPAIVWYDNRAKKEVDTLRSFLTDREFYQITGLLELETTPSAPKILWVKNNEKHIFDRIDKLFLVEDYIVYKFTKNFVSSASLLTSTGYFDINKRVYWDKVVEFLGIRENLPNIVEEGSIVGTVLPSVAEELGIRKDVIVVKGSMDQASGTVGAGNIKPGMVTESTGSAMAVAVTADETKYYEGVQLPYQIHAIPNKYLILPYAQTSGITYKWFRDELLGEEIDSSRSSQYAYEKLNNLASSVAPGSEGLVFLPFLAGASFPENDKYAKGVFYGITLKHGKGHFARSILESVGYILKNILDHVERFGVQFSEIHSMGGGARSDIWLQIKADICGYPVIKMEKEETATLGAAIIASVRNGDYATIEEAVSVMVKKGKSFVPNKEHYAAYMKNYELYKELYSSLSPIFRKYSGEGV